MKNQRGRVVDGIAGAVTKREARLCELLRTVTDQGFDSGLPRRAFHEWSGQGHGTYERYGIISEPAGNSRRDGIVMTARFTFRLGVIAIVAFALGLVVARLLLAPAPRTPPITQNATVLPTPRPLPELSLVNEDGKPLTTEYFRSGWTIVFFGFTHCPDVCPTTLALLAQTRRELADVPAAQQPRVLLVSVDPERDTPEKLKGYVTFFDKSFHAATGQLEQIEQAAAAFMVPFAKVPTPDGGYSMDHGAGIFFVAPSGSIMAYSSPPLQPQALAQDYRTTVQYFEESR